jgi:hypothetical protein
MLTDPETGEGLSISFWNSEEDMHASEASGFYHRKLSELEAFSSARPYASTTRLALRGRADLSYLGDTAVPASYHPSA